METVPGVMVHGPFLFGQILIKVKLGIPLEDTETKNRFEIRLKNDRAAHAMTDLLRGKNIERTTFSIINRYLRFVNQDERKRRTQWETNERWL